MELRRDGPSFTVDTLQGLHGQGWRPAQLFFIIGVDAFAEIATWHAYPAVLEAANFSHHPARHGERGLHCGRRS